MQFAKKTLCVLLVCAGLSEARAFSLLGSFTDTSGTWQTVDLGYNLAFLVQNPDVGGPMTLGEEYRWASPIITYGFDASFLNFFGDLGVAMVEGAFKILNDLPPVSGMSEDLREFPVDTRRFNYQASALGIRDLKSWALGAILEAIGLAPPERYTFTLRSRVLQNNIPVYTVIRRNFDPVKLEPSSYVNGVLYTYNIFHTFGPPTYPDVWEAVEIPIDPLAPTVTTVAAFVGLGGGTTDTRGSGVLRSAGIFYTGLTRDDVGGLRYLLKKSNHNIQSLPADAGSPTGGGSALGDAGSVPWLPAAGSLSAGTGTGTTTGTGQTVGGVGTGVGTTGTTTTSNIVSTALRPGYDKYRFVRVKYDSLLGFFATNNVVLYADTYITNGAIRQQIVQRTLTQPDILFTAADLGVDAQGVPILFNRTLTFAATTGGQTTTTNAVRTISGPVQITFSNIGPFLQNSPEGREEIAVRGLVWGSFDASTNAPIVFPSGTSIQELETVVLQSGGIGSAWRIP